MVSWLLLPPRKKCHCLSNENFTVPQKLKSLKTQPNSSKEKGPQSEVPTFSGLRLWIGAFVATATCAGARSPDRLFQAIAWNFLRAPLRRANAGSKLRELLSAPVGGAFHGTQTAPMFPKKKYSLCSWFLGVPSEFLAGLITFERSNL